MHQTRRAERTQIGEELWEQNGNVEMLAAINTEAEDQELTWDSRRGGLGWESQQLFRFEDTPRPELKLERKPWRKRKRKRRETYTG
jgi:hypothetical protein